MLFEIMINLIYLRQKNNTNQINYRTICTKISANIFKDIESKTLSELISNKILTIIKYKLDKIKIL